MNFRNLIKSTSLQFAIFRYFTLVIQTVNALLIAKYLGLYYFGIYSFVNLLLQYLSYTNFGIHYSITTILSTKNNLDEEEAQQLLSTSFIFLLVIGVLLLAGAFMGNYYGFFNHFSAYLLKDYYVIVILIAIIQHFNVLMVNVFRVYGKLFAINFNYIIIPLSQLSCVFFFDGHNLFIALLISIFCASVISFFIFLVTSPIDLKPNYNLPLKSLLFFFKRGFLLLLYNSSIYLIMLTARSMVGYYYPVEDFSLFSFANYLTQGIMMFLGSMAFLFYPKMLNKFSLYTDADKVEMVCFLEKSRSIYLTLTFAIVLMSLFFIPLIYHYLPDYRKSFTCFKYLLFSQLFLSNSFGYAELLIQREKEKILMVYGFVSVLIVLAAGSIFSYQLKLPFEFISIAYLISTAIYSYLVIASGNKITNQFRNRYALIKFFFNYRYFLPIAAFILLGFFISNVYAIALSAIIMYFFLNFREISFAYKNGMSIALNNDSLNIGNGPTKTS